MSSSFKAIKYRLHVALSTMDWTHSVWTPIEEIFIPEEGICFNSKGYAFKTSSRRYRKNKSNKEDKFPKQPSPEKLDTFQISYGDMLKIRRLLNYRDKFNEMAKKHLGVEPFKD